MSHGKRRLNRQRFMKPLSSPLNEWLTIKPLIKPMANKILRIFGSMLSRLKIHNSTNIIKPIYALHLLQLLIKAALQIFGTDMGKIIPFFLGHDPVHSST